MERSTSFSWDRCKFSICIDPHTDPLGWHQTKLKTVCSQRGARLLGEVLWLETITPEGNAHVHRIDFTGKKSQASHLVTCESLCREYIPIKIEYENADYPSQGPLHNTTWSIHEYSAMVTLALGILTRHYGDAKVICPISPKKCVRAL